ncbi:diacylglycerol/lipid kinase family protein [Microbacterium elymi]|uniref:YegS/DAGK C-terminal domain-containing protein n=1 Tax=Microbacterium elymi TaxID=2909587 RepID=A0ABY5NHM5_9MICO|nr:hypothetical protein [Microbacterium elymi]UUT34636.1 hypothetical protein L2X98_29525 [Microbacterium elymi]
MWGWRKLTRPDGTHEEHAFVVMGGMGLDAAMIANTNSQLKKSMGWVAYVDGAARSLPNAKPFRLMYERDGHRLHSARVQSMLFANCGTLPAGIELIPGASMTDGLLDVAMIQPTGWFGWLGVWRKVWWDNSVLRRTRSGRRIVERRKDTSIRYLRCPQIEAGVESAQAGRAGRRRVRRGRPHPLLGRSRGAAGGDAQQTHGDAPPRGRRHPLTAPPMPPEFRNARWKTRKIATGMRVAMVSAAR